MADYDQGDMFDDLDRKCERGDGLVQSDPSCCTGTWKLPVAATFTPSTVQGCSTRSDAA
jgi:hypothetical protein